MDEFVQRLIDDALARIEGFRRGGGTDDVSAFARSLERTALFLGATGVAQAARNLWATLGRRGEAEAFSAAVDARAELDDVANALRALGGRRQAPPPATAGTAPPTAADDVGRTLRLAVRAIRVGERLRCLDEAKVAMLETSIRDIGLRTPITVADDDAGGWRLVAGLHRLEAARRLGHPDIACFVLDRSQPAARLWEIDENLMRSELTQLERDQHLLRRKRIFDELAAGETGRNPPASGGRGNKGFAADTEQRIGIAKRRVNEALRRAGRIADDVREAIRGMPAADSAVELDALASLDVAEQKLAVERVRSGEAADFRAARRQIRGDGGDEATDRQVESLRVAWRHAGPAARGRFLRWLRDSAPKEWRDISGRCDAAPPPGRGRLRITHVGAGSDAATRTTG